MTEVTRWSLLNEFVDWTARLQEQERIFVGYNKLRFRAKDKVLVLDCGQAKAAGDFAVSATGLDYLNSCAAGRVSCALVALRPLDASKPVKAFPVAELIARINGTALIDGKAGPFYWFNSDGHLAGVGLVAAADEQIPF